MFITWIYLCISFFQAELVRSDELLDDSLTMKEVSQIYGLYSKVRFLQSVSLFQKRVDFIWVSKVHVICNWFGSALRSSVFGLKLALPTQLISYKLNPITAWSRAFSRAWCRLHICSRLFQATYFPALVAGYIFSRACYRLNIHFSRLPYYMRKASVQWTVASTWRLGRFGIISSCHIWPLRLH